MVLPATRRNMKCLIIASSDGNFVFVMFSGALPRPIRTEIAVVKENLICWCAVQTKKKDHSDLVDNMWNMSARGAQLLRRKSNSVLQAQSSTSLIAQLSTRGFAFDVCAQTDPFKQRHIGPSESDAKEMLKTVTLQPPFRM